MRPHGGRVLSGIALLAAVAVAGPTTTAIAQSGRKAPPRIAAVGIRNLKPTSVNVRPTINPRGEATNVIVQYGKGSRLRASTAGNPIAAGRKNVSILIGLTNLAPVTRYSYRVVAISVDGRTNGPVKTFKTPKIPPSATLGASPAVIRPGQTVALSGAIGGTGSGGVRVFAEQRPFPFVAPFTAFPNALIAAANGSFTFHAQPPVTTHYRVRATVGGRATASPIVSVGVAPWVALRVRRVGGRVRFSGSVRPGGDAVVKLRRLTRSGRRVTISRTTAKGQDVARFRFRARRLRRTARYLVLVQPTNGAYVKGESEPRRVRRTF
jgi:hypothetical protein